MKKFKRWIPVIIIIAAFMVGLTGSYFNPFYEQGNLLTANLYAHTPSDKDVFATVNKKDSKSYRFTIHNAYSYKEPDLTDYVVKFRIKKAQADTTYIMNKTCTLQTQSGDTKGKCYAVISRDDTTYILGDDTSDELVVGTYYAYLIITDEAGDTENTILESKWILTYAS